MLANIDNIPKTNKIFKNVSDVIFKHLPGLNLSFSSKKQEKTITDKELEKYVHI